MHEPRTGVIGPESDQEPALGGEHGDVAAGRVVALEARDVDCGIKHVAGLADGRHVGGAAEDQEIVAVQVDGMREREGAIGIVLDQPVLPLVDAVNVDDVVRLRVVGESLHHVLQHRLVPVDVNGRSVDAPGEAVERDGDLVAGVERDAVGVHAALEDGRQGVEVQALVVGRSDTPVGGKPVRCALVLEDGSRGRVVGETAEAAAAKGHVEPVVPDSLVGIDDHVVALADSEHQAVNLVGLHGNKIGRDDGHGVVYQRKLEVVLNRRVDESDAMLLALGERHRGILASPGSRVLGEPVEEDVVARGRAGTLGVVGDAVGRLIVVVHERERTKIDIIVG